jgi:CheY-like chemotaxis protein
MRPFLTCFLIDDDPDDHDIFKMALNGISDRLQCVTAADGADGIEKLERNEEFTPDYIFLDLNMPRVDGRACLKEIRKIERLTKVPVIIYSTSVATKDMEETKELSADGYIVKQPRLELLKQKLIELFKANGHDKYLQ